MECSLFLDLLYITNTFALCEGKDLNPLSPSCTAHYPQSIGPPPCSVCLSPNTPCPLIHLYIDRETSPLAPGSFVTIFIIYYLTSLVYYVMLKVWKGRRKETNTKTKSPNGRTHFASGSREKGRAQRTSKNRARIGVKKLEVISLGRAPPTWKNPAPRSPSLTSRKEKQ